MVRIALSLAVIVSGLGTAAWMTAPSQRRQHVWDHWDVVKRGYLYRSGQLPAAHLEAAVRAYRLRTVVSFLRPGPDVDAERALCKELGVGFVNLPMPGDGFGSEAQFCEVLKAVDDPSRRPVLVHCARGTCRTGAAVALYRYERDGWTLEDVADEMHRQTYRDDWLPAYMYAMATNRPNSELFEPQIVRDDPPKEPRGDR